MQAAYTVSHAKYTGSSDSDGYPTGDAYAAAVDRRVYGIYPLSSQMSESADYDLRVVTSKVLLAPDTSVFSPRDKVIIPGSQPIADRTYFVSQDVRDYSMGPFGFRPSGDATAFGEVILETASGWADG